MSESCKGAEIMVRGIDDGTLGEYWERADDTPGQVVTINGVSVPQGIIALEQERRLHLDMDHGSKVQDVDHSAGVSASLASKCREIVRTSFAAHNELRRGS